MEEEDCGIDRDEEEVGGIWMVGGVEEEQGMTETDQGAAPPPPPPCLGEWIMAARDKKGKKGDAGSRGRKNVVKFGGDGCCGGHGCGESCRTEMMESVGSNRFQVLEDEDGGGHLEINAVEEVMGIVEVTIDSGAARSVWPWRKGGVARTKSKQNVKLAAANGSEIKVSGEAQLEFKRRGRRCAMKFLDADVKKPLASVSTIVDEGNKVIFGPERSYIENNITGEKIELKRRNGVFILEVESDGKKVTEKKKQDGGKMEVGEVNYEHEEEDRTEFRRRLAENEMVVFRRQAS